jgi:hypothetical protein
VRINAFGACEIVKEFKELSCGKLHCWGFWDKICK